jgi:hypothetical protein
MHTMIRPHVVMLDYELVDLHLPPILRAGYDALAERRAHRHHLQHIATADLPCAQAWARLYG